VNLATFLLALSLIESGGNDHAVGAAGDRGRYQISMVVWAQHSNLSFVYAFDPVKAEKVARDHIEWLRKYMPSNLSDDPKWVALAWTCGLDRCQKAGWRWDALPKKKRDFACRVSNLYEDIELRRSGLTSRQNRLRLNP
jgi:hypothetical protein